MSSSAEQAARCPIPPPAKHSTRTPEGIQVPELTHTHNLLSADQGPPQQTPALPPATGPVDATEPRQVGRVVPPRPVHPCARGSHQGAQPGQPKPPPGKRPTREQGPRGAGRSTRKRETKTTTEKEKQRRSRQGRAKRANKATPGRRNTELREKQQRASGSRRLPSRTVQPYQILSCHEQPWFTPA